MLAVTVCGAVDPVRRAGLAGLLRRPALPVQPAARRLPVHVLHRAGCARARRTGSTRARSPTDCAPRCWPAPRRRASRCATAAATATSTARASTPAPRSAGSRRAASPRSRRPRGPETVLCGEAELPYALLGYLTDYANGVQDEATPVATLVEMMAASTDAFASVLRAALPRAAAAPRAAGRRLPLSAPEAGRELGQRRVTRTVVSAWPEMRKSASRNASPRARPTRTLTPSKRAVAVDLGRRARRAWPGRDRRPRSAPRRRRG